MSGAMTAVMAVNAVGSLMQGQAQSNAASYNAAVAQQNAVAAQQQGQAAAEAQQRDAQRKIGAMVASYGASGVQSDAGSPMDVLADSVRMATLDNLTTKYNYQMKALGYQNQAELYDMQADNASTAGVLNAFGSIANTYGTFKRGTGTGIPTFG